MYLNFPEIIEDDENMKELKSSKWKARKAEKLCNLNYRTHKGHIPLTLKKNLIRHFQRLNRLKVDQNTFNPKNYF